MPKDLIRLSEASQISGLHHSTLRNYVKQGRLTGYVVGCLHKVDLHEVEALTKIQPTEAS